MAASPAKPGDVALYEIEPLLHLEYGYQSPSYVPHIRLVDDRAPPADLMPPATDARRDLLDEWKAKRAMAEGVGGSFEVRARPSAPASPPPRPGFSNRPIFGRKTG